MLSQGFRQVFAKFSQDFRKVFARFSQGFREVFANVFHHLIGAGAPRSVRSRAPAPIKCYPEPPTKPPTAVGPKFSRPTVRPVVPMLLRSLTFQPDV